MTTDNDTALAAGSQFNLGVARQPLVELSQCFSHCLLDRGDKYVGVLRELEGIVVDSALAIEIGGQVIVRIAVAIGAFDPNLFAPQPFTQGL